MISKIYSLFLDDLKERLRQKNFNSSIYLQRFNQEIKVFKKNTDLLDFVMENDCVNIEDMQRLEYVYPRGITNNSLIFYLAGLSSIDPVKYELQFSLFMNEINEGKTEFSYSGPITFEKPLRNKKYKVCFYQTKTTVSLMGFSIGLGKSPYKITEDFLSIKEMIKTDEAQLCRLLDNFSDINGKAFVSLLKKYKIDNLLDEARAYALMWTQNGEEINKKHFSLFKDFVCTKEEIKNNTITDLKCPMRLGHAINSVICLNRMINSFLQLENYRKENK